MSKLTKNAVSLALHKTHGNISAASRKLRVTRAALQNRINHDEDLQKLLIDSRETMLDEGESSLLKAVKRGEGWAVCFLLKTQGRDRGYIERHQTEHMGGQVVLHVHEEITENPLPPLPITIFPPSNGVISNGHVNGTP